VTFPRRIEVEWGHLHVNTRPSLAGRRVVVANDEGRHVALTMTLLASGAVFGRSRAWRETALEALVQHLTRFDTTLR
jgi:hypothetical protein